jgi:hypothetical protein
VGSLLRVVVDIKEGNIMGKNSIVDRTVDLREAEAVFLKATQALIAEKINWEFCLEIGEYMQDGLPAVDALRKAIRDHNYHLSHN